MIAEATREIYWNVGHGVVWLMYPLAVLALSICVWGFYLRVRVYRRSRPLNRTDQPARRLKIMVWRTVSQSRVLRVRAPGILHSAFFWGFSMLFAGTLLVMIQADFSDPVLRVDFLKGTFYLAFSLALDLAGLAVLAMLAGLLVRRFIFRPKGLETGGNDYFVHALLFAILATGFLVEGARMAVTEIPTNPGLALFSPVGDLVARLLAGLSTAQLLRAHRTLWWVHFFLAMAFIVAIPFTKLRHLVTVPFKYFSTDLAPKGTLTFIDLEDDAVQQYGAAKVTDLPWKDILDADACTKCKRCQDRCPAWATDKPLSPMRVVQQIGQTAFAKPEANLCTEVTPDALWACTTCRACEEICPTNVEHVGKIVEMRRNLVLMEGSFPGDEVRAANDNLEVNGNPFGLAWAARADWASGLDVRIGEEIADADILYFVGCYASFDKRNQDVARSFLHICNSAGIHVGMLGRSEKCCGEPVRKLGNEYLYRMLALENVRTIVASGATHIVTTCPHCYNTLARDYRELGLALPVEHYTTFVARLLADGLIRAVPAPLALTYHDSCYLGRYRDIVNEPRIVLTALGGQISEMERSGYESFCCGGGGGRILAEESLGRRINVERVEMARSTEAPLLVSSCPFCLTMFEDGIKAAGCEAELQVRDLAEIVAERMRPGLPAGQTRPEVNREDTSVRQAGP